MKKVKKGKYVLSVWVYARGEGDMTVKRYFDKRPSPQTIKTIVAGVWKELSNRGVPVDLDSNIKYYASVSTVKKEK
jgi:hypothetical protein